MGWGHNMGALCWRGQVSLSFVSLLRGSRHPEAGAHPELGCARGHGCGGNGWRKWIPPT